MLSWLAPSRTNSCAVPAERVATERVADDRPAAVPAADIHRTDAAVVVRLDMPGVAPDAVEVTVDGDDLTIAGTVKPAAPLGRLVAGPGLPGQWRRRFTLGDGLDRDRIRATAKDGVVTVEVALAASHQPRRIPVSAG
jgi:HSP20 family molecular chaperone IbpA